VRVRLRVLLVPFLLGLATAAVLVWIAHAELDAAETAVLSTANLGARAREHLNLTVVSVGLATAVAVPCGVLVSRPFLRRVSNLMLFVANVGQTVPTVAVLALMLTVTGLGFRTAVFALWAYALLPVLQNTLVGLRGVDAATVEAALGVGMSPRQVLWRIELPLALPVIMAGLRTAAVISVGTAALGTFIGAGGLGQIIEAGIRNQRDHLLYVGATLTALLALAVDWAVASLGALVTPDTESTRVQVLAEGTRARARATRVA
jgi:osmoprotectant transport system permease protein